MVIWAILLIYYIIIIISFNNLMAKIDHIANIIANIKLISNYNSPNPNTLTKSF